MEWGGSNPVVLTVVTLSFSRTILWQMRQARDSAANSSRSSSIPSPSMPSTRLEHCSIKNKAKRQVIARQLKREKSESQLRSGLAIAKAKLTDPAVKKVRLPSSRCRVNWLDNVCRLAQNVPKILDSQREFDASVPTAGPLQRHRIMRTPPPLNLSRVQIAQTKHPRTAYLWPQKPSLT